MNSEKKNTKNPNVSEGLLRQKPHPQPWIKTKLRRITSIELEIGFNGKFSWFYR